MNKKTKNTFKFLPSSIFAVLFLFLSALSSQAALQSLYKSSSERGSSSESSAGTVISAINPSSSGGYFNTQVNTDGTTSLLNAAGSIIANVKLDTNGNVTSATDANGNTLKISTDAAGNTVLKDSSGNEVAKVQTAAAQNSSGSDFSGVSYGKGYYTPMEAIPGLGRPGTFNEYAGALYRFGVGAIGICAMLMIIIGGYMYVASAGNNASMEKAKGVITDAILGLLLALSSYLILYVINPDLVKIKKLGTATSTTGTAETGTAGGGATETTGGQKSASCTGIKSQVSQCGDASPQLNAFLECITGKVGANNVVISSISDGNGGVNCYTEHPDWPQCPSSGGSNCCYHAKNSCHYGGTGCSGSSYAVDFSGSQSSASQSDIISAAQSCNGWAQSEGNHTHASIGGSCGCN